MTARRTGPLVARDVDPAAQVVDASATLAAFFEDEADPFADAVLASIAEGATRVPAHWLLECGNALHVAVRRGRIDATERDLAAVRLAALPVAVEPIGPLQAVLAIAERHDLSAYDAAYLELAIRRAAVLVTRDERLAAAARAARHPVRWRRPRR
jgi:predicted nucleic acid-binding protein